MASNKDLDDCVFNFDGEGEGGFFRVPMTNLPGELNRRVMVNTGDKFQLMATLLDVAHGKLKDGSGDDATLLVASFRFLPSGGKRFVNANITWTFISDDPAVEIEVQDIAPEGSWALNPMTLKLESTIGAKIEIGTGAGPVAAKAAGEYTGKKAKDLEYHTLVEGSMRVEDRDYGEFNSARWSLQENEQDPRGICRMLQVGILLKRTVVPGMRPRSGSVPTFKGTVDITVDKGVWSKAKKTILERVYKKTTKDEAVVFRADTDRVSGHFDIEKTDLSAISLTDDIMYMSLHESFEAQRKERDERKQKKREAEAKKQEDEARRQEEQDKRKQEQEARNKQDDGEKRTADVAGAATGTGTLPQAPTGGPDVSPIGLPPTWLLYIALGIVGMYFWQQLVKFVSVGN